MPSLRSPVYHTFAGGWATAYGPSLSAISPDANGRFAIPYLWEAEDLEFELDGGLHKAPGATALSSELESGATIMGAYDYWRQGVLGSPTQKRVVHVGTKVYKDDADGSFTEIASGLTDGAIPNYATFDDLLVVASDQDAPKSWDQTTWQALAGSPPNFSFSCKHKNWHWAAGVFALPSRLYYSAQLNPEDWAGATSGHIDIDPNDGDMITGLMSHKGELWVFKGPYKGSIHRVTGTSNADWARTTFIEGVGAVWQNSIFRFRDDVGFLWSDGSIRTLKATDAYGDFREASLTTLIQPWLDSHIHASHFRKCWAVTDGRGEKVYVTIPVDSSTTNNAVLVGDLRFEPIRWSRLVSYAMASLAVVLDPTDGNRPKIHFGGYDGKVWKYHSTTKTVDGTTGLAFKATTPFIDYGAPHLMKTLAGGALGLMAHNAGNIAFKWTRDGNAQQSQDVAQGGSAVLDAFTLGTSKLAGERYNHRWFQTEEGGEFRAVQYELTHSDNNRDAEVHNLVAMVLPGAESMEND